MKPPAPKTRSRPTAQRQADPPEIVDPRWLASALAITLAAALFCAWLTLCLLFYQGSWQLVLHPSHTVEQTPASAGLPFEPIHFDATETGEPRLTGWWIPAQPAALPGPPSAAGSSPTSHPSPQKPLSFQQPPRYAGYTILYLHDGSGSLSNTIPSLNRLHRAGINVFAIDYRGFGQSDSSSHPTEARMLQDAAAALNYLTTTRQIPVQQIIPYGVGLGASLAARLAVDHPGFPALVLDNPDPNPTATALTTHPSHLVPMTLLFREHFDIAAPLASLSLPKLLIAGGPVSPESSRIAAQQLLFHRAASPTRSVTLLPAHYDEDYRSALTGFFDQYLPRLAPAP